MLWGERGTGSLYGEQILLYHDSWHVNKWNMVQFFQNKLTTFLWGTLRKETDFLTFYTSMEPQNFMDDPHVIQLGHAPSWVPKMHWLNTFTQRLFSQKQEIVAPNHGFSLKVHPTKTSRPRTPKESLKKVTWRQHRTQINQHKSLWSWCTLTRNMIAVMQGARGVPC